MKDKSRLPQILVLGLLVAFCAGFIVVKVSGKKPAPVPAQTEAAQSPVDEQSAKSETPDNVTQPAGDSKAVAGSGKMIVAVPASAETGARLVKRDPFTPGLNASTTSTSTPPRPYPAPRVRIDTGATIPFIPAVGPLPFGAGSTQPGGVTPLPTVDTVEPAFPSFELTGIITGTANVAIIRLGESKHIVKEGQLINGKYKVVTVSQDGVLLSGDGKSVFLKLGGDGNAS